MTLGKAVNVVLFSIRAKTVETIVTVEKAVIVTAGRNDVAAGPIIVEYMSCVKAGKETKLVIVKISVAFPRVTVSICVCPATVNVINDVIVWKFVDAATVTVACGSTSQVVTGSKL